MKAIVVGAGIVGTSCAWFLARDGHEVLLLDPREPGSGTSSGNAGVLSVESCLPLARLSLLRAAPAMLLDPEGPFRLRWRYLPRLLPWLLRYLLAARPARARAVAEALVALIRRADEAHDRVIEECGLGELVRTTGWLKVARDPNRFERAIAEEREALDRFALPYRILTREELLAREPALTPEVRCALWLTADRHVASPLAYTRGILRAFEACGGRWLPRRATGFRRQGTRIAAVVTEEGEMAADLVVLAAGVFSRGLAAGLGLSLPLEAERGYHLMLARNGCALAHPVYGIEEGFLLAPIEGAVRLTTGVELASPEAPPDYRWPRRLVPKAQRLLPGLPGRIEREWLGLRPSLPDGLPVLGRAPRIDNLLLAFGHQHLGLTLGPLTGRIVADLAAGRDPGLDLAPYAADRRFF